MLTTGSAGAIVRLLAKAGFAACAVVIAAFHVMAGLGLEHRVATAAEARLASALVVLPPSLTWPDAAIAYQLRILGSGLDMVQGVAVIDVVRWVGLAAGVVTCVLVWPICRQLGARPAAAGLAVALCGLPAVVASVHASVGPGGLGAMWLAVAVALSGTRPGGGVRVARSVLAVGAAAVGLVTVPVAGAAALVLVAHLVATGGVLTGLGRVARWWVVGGGLVAAGVVVVVGTGGRGLAAPVVGVSAVGVVAAVGTLVVVVCGVTWWRVRWLGPIGSAALVLLVCVLVPGTDSGTVLALLVPVLAVVTGVLIDELATGLLDRRPALALATVALLAAAVPILVPVDTTTAATPVPDASRPLATSARTALRPSMIAIPVLKVQSDLVDLGVDPSGELQAPYAADVAGWFAAGTVPGDLGPAVIGGHVDSRTGPGIFKDLGMLDPGDIVHITRSDERTLRFMVVSVQRHRKEQFPTEEVYGPTPAPELRLVTCGGRFDPVARSYRDNIVVMAVLV